MWLVLVPSKCNVFTVQPSLALFQKEALEHREDCYHESCSGPESGAGRTATVQDAAADDTRERRSEGYSNGCNFVGVMGQEYRYPQLSAWNGQQCMSLQISSPLGRKDGSRVESGAAARSNFS